MWRRRNFWRAQVVAARSMTQDEPAPSPVVCFCNRQFLTFNGQSSRKYLAGDAPSAFLNVSDERRHRFIPEVARNLLHRRTRGKASDCDDQLQLLSPTAEGQAGLLLEQDASEFCSLPLALPIAPSCFGQTDHRPMPMRCGVKARLICQW